MSFFDVLGSDTQREHAFQKKIPGEKKGQEANQLNVFDLFSTKANFANIKTPNLT